MKKYLFILAVVLILIGCAPSVQATGTHDGVKQAVLVAQAEDVNVYRFVDNVLGMQIICYFTVNTALHLSAPVFCP
jgi:hypothetical protein